MRDELNEKIYTQTNQTRIDLANIQIQDSELAEIMQILHTQQPNMSVLDLDFNAIQDLGAKILSESLLAFPMLIELSIRFNNIGRAGAILLFSLKKELPDLKILFQGNQIFDAGEMAEIEQLALGSKVTHRHGSF